MRLSIYQPQYFPRLHYVNRVLDSDVFMLLCGAQHTPSMTHVVEGRRERRKTYQVHAPIKQPDGEHLLTLPVSSRGKLAAIEDVWPDDNQQWRRLHCRSIKSAYGRAPFFDVRFDEVVELLDRGPEPVATLTTRTLLWALDVVLDLQIGVDHLSVAAVNERLAGQHGTRLRRIVVDRETGVERPEGRQMGDRWILDLCTALGADEYVYGGTAATGYMREQEYASKGIHLVQQTWQAVPYPQRFENRAGFLPNLSVLDLLFNVAPDHAAQLLQPTAAAVAQLHR